MVYHGELGKWWQNSDIAKKLQLSDGQIGQLDQTFYDHKMKLIDYGAAMEKEDLKLQTLLDADVPNEGQVEAQVDQVLQARGKLEREYTMMNLDLRKVLSARPVAAVEIDTRTRSGPAGEPRFLPESAPSRRRAHLHASARTERSRCRPCLPPRLRTICTEARYFLRRL